MPLTKTAPKARIYADAAAATPLSPAAKKELIRLLDVAGNAGALHQEALAAKEVIETARERIAAAVGAHENEIIFTASGTESNNLAIQGILRPLLQQHGELHAITCAIEHQSVLEPLRALEAEGLYTTVLPVDREGFVALKDLQEAINDQTAFVSIQLVNSEVGTIEPVREIAKIIRAAKRSRIPKSDGKTWPSGPERPSGRNSAERDSDDSLLPLYFHTDAAQAPLWLPLAVDALGVDLLTLDAQKILGPKGVGILYVRRGSDIEPVLRGGTQEMNVRAGTPNTPLVGAFGVAMAEAARGVEARAAKTALVRDYLFDEIKKRVPEVVVNGPRLPEHAAGRVANNLNISIPGLDAEMAVLALDAEGVAVSTRSACNTGSDEPSHVIAALGVAGAMAKTAIRITLLPSATKADAKNIAEALQRVVKRYQTSI